MGGRKKKKKSREKVVGCQTGVEAPRRSLPVPPQPVPSPPTPPPLPVPGRKGVDMGAKMGWRRGETQHTRIEAELLT